MLLICRRFPFLKHIPPDHLQWLLNTGKIQELETGQALFTKGEPTDYMHLILEGQIDISLDQNGQL